MLQKSEFNYTTQTKSLILNSHIEFIKSLITVESITML